MVPVELLRSAIEQLPKWSPKVTTAVTWVNWRQGFQIKMSWFGSSSFVCYLDFKKNKGARAAVLKTVFDKFAVTGQKPGVIDGHGWTAMDFSLHSSAFISVNDVAAMATEMGYDFSILYVQEDISSRSIFTLMGIPLVPGEMGKEWINGQFLSYSRPVGMCL